MELEIEGQEKEVRIKIHGEVVASNCGSLRESVMDVMTRQPELVVLNMKDVPFIDTSGIGVMVGLRAHLKSRKTVLALEDPSPRVHQVLRMMRLLPVFGLKED